MDRDLLARAYDRSADGYDQRFRELQREKYRAGARLLASCPLQRGPVLDAGGGTGLFQEWLADPEEPAPELRERLRGERLVVLDASLGMLRRARSRAPLCVAADLSRPPLRPAFALVVAFTSVLGDAAASLRALSSLVAPGGALLLTFLAGEAPPAAWLARVCAMRPGGGPLPAGQDRAFLLQRM